MRLLVCTQALDRTDPMLGFFHRWVEEFAAHCEEVSVICLFEGEHKLPHNVRIYSLGKERRSQNAREPAPAGLAHVLLRLRYGVRTVVLAWRLRSSYDSVFVHMNPEYLLSAGWLWRFLGKRVGLWYTHKHVSVRLRAGVGFAHVVFTASKESFRLSSHKMRILGHGIDTARYIPPRVPRAELVRLMTTGRITRSKGIDVMVEAFLTLKTKGVAASFIVYGAPTSPQDVEYQARLSSRLREAGERPEKVFVGAVPHEELPARRAQADYLLHASETGSLDKNVLDAAMSGVIPISSSEAYGELFAGYETFLHYPKKDSAALALRIMALEALPEDRRREIRDTLRARVENQHSLKNLIPRILASL